MTIDTLKLAKNLLQRHDFTQSQAGGLVAELRATVTEGIATKSDIGQLHAATTAGFTLVREEMRSEFALVREEARSEFALVLNGRVSAFLLQ